MKTWSPSLKGQDCQDSDSRARNPHEAPCDYASQSRDAGSVPGAVPGGPSEQLGLSFIQCVGSWEIQPNWNAAPTSWPLFPRSLYTQVFLGRSPLKTALACH